MPNEIIYWAAVNGGGVSVPFVPNSLSGMVLWLDAQDTSTVTTGAGAEVTQWTDKSTNGLTAVQVNAGSNPTLLVTGLNGKQAVDFSGANQILASSFGSPLNFTAGGSDTGYTYFTVYQVDTATITTCVFARGTAAIGPYQNMLNGDNFIFRSTTSTTFIGVQGTAFAITAPLVTACVYSGSANFQSFEIFVNGSAATYGPSTSAVAYVNMNPTDTSNLTFGMRTVAGFFDGKIGEVIMYNRRLLASEVTQVNDYLLDHWGI